MKPIYHHLDSLIKRYPQLKNSEAEIINSFEILKNCYKNKGKMLIAGNGGSASDALHIVGELMKGFTLKRNLDKKLCNTLEKFSSNAEYYKFNLQMPLPAIALVNEISLMTAYGNDVAPDLIFAQQVLGYGKEGDVFLGISTSGNSKNVIYAAEIAKALKMRVIGLTGENGGILSTIADICIKVPESKTYRIQELHLPVYHALCLELEKYFFERMGIE